MITTRKTRLFSALAALAVAFTMVTVDAADARRGGSFGSRGGRTFQSVPSTSTAPSVAPVQRSMTQPGMAASRPAAGAASTFNRPSFGGSLMRGLMIGGLIGLLFGGGFGGLAGMFGFIIQALIIAALAMLALRFFRSRQQGPATAGGPQAMHRSGYDERPQNGGLMGGIPGIGSRLGDGGSGRRTGNPDEIGIGQRDLDIFERRLAELQDAYSREDYGTLRRITTPEMMGYLSEELGQNASKGLRNEVSDVRLLQGDVAESWREGSSDYATVAMRYSSRDVTRERSSGRVVQGDESPSESTELWTFVRERGGDWTLSAIQEA
ncbi:Tim44 domain-containing protein [Aureimonas leprariae]|uniref:Tim44 domain-containing protein n=1 Tax=Plantimonas leprariae TaxID=2615207 RepID=A0A7V7PS70_9HYPH|nr:Tim44 domain-containing protein [Aureimonas leprariae]KAB0681943.1 Tim44 domain-containing protein [Aureimonas leprariae]